MPADDCHWSCSNRIVSIYALNPYPKGLVLQLAFAKGLLNLDLRSQISFYTFIKTFGSWAHRCLGRAWASPHTSGTALRKCVCNVLVCLWSYTINYKCALKCLNVLVQLVGHGNAGLLLECSVGNCSEDGSNLSMHDTLLPVVMAANVLHFLLVLKYSWYGHMECVTSCSF